MGNLHPTAVVDPGATIAEDASVGPFCVVGPDVHLAAGVKLHSHVVVEGRTTIGARSVVYPFASIGHPPQDLKYAGEPSRVEIGEETVIREQVTINPGTQGGGMLTRVGDRCLLMVGAHVAHDCQVGNGVILANNVTLGGHVVVEDHAIIGGLVAVHQHVRIGRHAMIGGFSGIEHDVIPYGLAMGERARLNGINIVGMRRHGFERDEIHGMLEAYEELFGEEGTLADRLEALPAEQLARHAVSDVVTFIRAAGGRALCQPKRAHAR